MLARQGKLDIGESLVREAVAQSRETDDLNIQADKLIDLAEVLRLAGREDELDPLLVRRSSSTSGRATECRPRGHASHASGSLPRPPEAASARPGRAPAA